AASQALSQVPSVLGLSSGSPERAPASSVAAGAAGLVDCAVDLADHVGVRHPCVLEDHLAILIEPPAALVEHLADAEAGRVARHQEHGDTLLERDSWISTRVDEEQLANRGVSNESLLPVKDPLVALAFGLQPQARLGIVDWRQAIVGARARLGNALAKHEGIVGYERLEEALLLVVGAGS